MRKRAEIEDDITLDEVDLIKYEDHSSDEELEDLKQVKRVLSIDDMLKESGGFGLYHLLTFLLCILVG